MTIRTRITQAARQRGWTAAEVARCLKMYPSNISAMDAGRRCISLKKLARVAQLLDCSLGDLIDTTWCAEGSPFGRSRLTQKLKERDLGIPDGSERGWVHAAMLAWLRHYRNSKKLSR